MNRFYDNIYENIVFRVWNYFKNGLCFFSLFTFMIHIKGGTEIYCIEILANVYDEQHAAHTHRDMMLISLWHAMYNILVSM